jgi:predicted DNA-binding transcriptional regulator YafY
MPRKTAAGADEDANVSRPTLPPAPRQTLPPTATRASIPPISPSRASIPAPPPSRVSVAAPPPRASVFPSATIPPRRGRPKGSFTQARRLETLRALLVRHPKGLSLYDLARELNVTPRSMRRYLDEVKREIDLVSHRVRPGGQSLWRLAPGEAIRKVEVRRTQAYALLAARRLFEPMKGSALYEEISMASEKLLTVAKRPGRGPNAGLADARLEERFLYLPFAPKDYGSRTEELDDVFQAVADLRPLQCRYRRNRDGKEERIVIHPYAMVLYKDAIYCVGLHVAKEEVRTFLLDRMRDTDCSIEGRFELPDDFRIEDYFQGQFGIWHGGEPQRVVIDFDARVREYVETRRIHPSQEIAVQEDGSVRLSMTIGDLTEVTTWVLGFGETANVVEPESLRQRVRSELENALKRYGLGPTTPAPALVSDPAKAPVKSKSRPKKQTTSQH